MNSKKAKALRREVKKVYSDPGIQQLVYKQAKKVVREKLEQG